MSEMQIAIVVTILVVVAVPVMMVLFMTAAGGPLALETEQHLRIVLRRVKDPVFATLQVTGISEPIFDNTDCRAELTGVISGDGIEPRAVQRKGTIAVARWPKVGDRLPVIIDRANPKLFFIDQTNVAVTGEAALAEAERLAAEMKAGSD